MNLPMLGNDGSELNYKKNYATFDQPFYSSNNMLNKGRIGSNENLHFSGPNGTSSIYEFAKAQRKQERKKRKDEFNKKINNVYKNPTIFRVAPADARNKAKSTNSQSLNVPNGPLQQLMDPMSTLPAAVNAR